MSHDAKAEYGSSLVSYNLTLLFRLLPTWYLRHPKRQPRSGRQLTLGAIRDQRLPYIRGCRLEKNIAGLPRADTTTQ